MVSKRDCLRMFYLPFRWANTLKAYLYEKTLPYWGYRFVRRYPIYRVIQILPSTVRLAFYRNVILFKNGFDAMYRIQDKPIDEIVSYQRFVWMLRTKDREVLWKQPLYRELVREDIGEDELFALCCEGRGTFSVERFVRKILEEDIKGG